MAKSEDRVVARELRGRADAELRSLVDTKHDELNKARLKRTLGQLQRTHTLKQLKRDIARLHTVLGERVPKASKAQAGKEQAT